MTGVPSRHHTTPIASAVSANRVAAELIAYLLGAYDTDVALALLDHRAKSHVSARRLYAGQMVGLGMLSCWPRSVIAAAMAA